MRKILFLLFLAVCLNSYSQGTAKSLNLGVSPVFGNLTATIHSSDKSDAQLGSLYMPYFNLSLGYEAQFNGGLTLVELAYANATLASQELKGNALSLPFTSFSEKAWSASLTGYYGYTINSKKRLQIPLYFGAGFDYVNSDSLSILTFAIAAKARLKFYFTDRIGIFVGVNFRTGMGSEEPKDGHKYPVTSSQVAPDLGLIYSF